MYIHVYIQVVVALCWDLLQTTCHELFSAIQSLGVSSRRKDQLASQTKTSSGQKLRRLRRETGKGEKRARDQGSDDVWFDDIPLNFKNGEPVPMTSKKKPVSTSLTTGSDKRYIV